MDIGGPDKRCTIHPSHPSNNRVRCKCDEVKVAGDLLYHVEECDKCRPMGGREMKLIIEVTDCGDCPCKKHHREQGVSFDYCSHPKTDRGAYERMLSRETEEPPEWCPIKSV